jgi:putative endonuclease
MTNNLAKRALRHKSRRANQFAAKYDVDKLVYFEKHQSLEAAIYREQQLKKWNRRWKIRLIEQFNPTWQDLFIKAFKSILLSGSPAENQRS